MDQEGLKKEEEVKHKGLQFSKKKQQQKKLMHWAAKTGETGISYNIDLQMKDDNFLAIYDFPCFLKYNRHQ